jgi:hypothetical protein
MAADDATVEGIDRTVRELRHVLRTRGPLPHVRDEAHRVQQLITTAIAQRRLFPERLGVQTLELVRDCGGASLEDVRRSSKTIMAYWARQRPANFVKVVDCLLTDAHLLRAEDGLDEALRVLEVADALLRTRCDEDTAEHLLLRYRAAVLRHRIRLGQRELSERDLDAVVTLAHQINTPSVLHETALEEVGYWVGARRLDRAHAALARVGPRPVSAGAQRYAIFPEFSRLGCLRAHIDLLVAAGERGQAAPLILEYGRLGQTFESVFHARVAASAPWPSVQRQPAVMRAPVYIPIVGFTYFES